MNREVKKMKREKIKSLYMDPAAFADREITVCGWARTIRDMKSFGFLELNDGSCFKGLQVVFAADAVENYAEVAKQNVGAAFVVRGTFVLTPEAKQPFELKALEIRLETEDGVAEALVREGYDPLFGARPLRRVLRDCLEDPAARLLLEGRVRAGDSLLLTVREGEPALLLPEAAAAPR